MTVPHTNLVGQHPPPADGYHVAVFEAHLATMAQQLATMQRTGDRRAVFQLTYLTFSREVLAGVRAQRFEDPEWAIDMCCRFVEVYLEQSARWERRDPTQCGAWRRAFSESESGRASVLQAMLLGMNAHINYDLAFVTLGACQWAGDLKAPGALSVLRASQAGVPIVRYRDFLRINDIAWASLPRIQDTVLAAFQPVFYVGNLLARRLTMAVGERILLHAREASWCQTALLLHARDEAERAAVEQLIDLNAVSIAGRIDLLSGRPWRMWRAERQWRDRDAILPPGVTDTVLAMAARDPGIADLALRQLAEVGVNLVPAIRRHAEHGRIADASALALAAVRYAPRRPVEALRAFLRVVDDRREQVLEHLIMRCPVPTVRDAGWPLARVRRRWRRREALGRAALAHLTLAPASPVRAALEHDVAEMVRHRAALGDTVTIRPAHIPALTSLVDRLLQHDDRWVRLTTYQQASTLGLRPTLDSHMTSLIDRVLFLKETSVFLEVDPSTLLHVAERMQEETIASGAHVVVHGSPSDGIRFITDGIVEVRQDRGGRSTMVARLERLAAIGELSTLNATAATADCVAVTPVRCLLLPADVLLELLTQHHRLAIGLLRTLSDRLIATTQRLESVG